MRNIYSNLPANAKEEIFERLSGNESIDIERVISRGQRSPDGFWYDQPRDEFVLLLKGKAVIEFDDNTSVKLIKGDYLLIPAHRRHRVSKTSKRPSCIWLTVHF